MTGTHQGTSWRGREGFSNSLIKSALIRQNRDRDVYISARKSMTVQCYLHSIAKRAKVVSLVDSGATENFLNLTYAKWLQLPIKKIKDPWKLYNVDGTENKTGELQYYTDLETQMGTTIHKLRFFLMDLREHKAILGYPWFTAVQPNIDWKKGWINHTQLSIILWAPNAQKATFTLQTKNVPCTKPEVRYFIGRVTIRPKQPHAPKKGRIPKEYHRHGKVFSKEKSQRLPRHTIWDHTIELLPNAPATLPTQLLPLNRLEQEEMQKFVEEHLRQETIRES
jgi:hypothetical protein